jgi:hypothetical protein
LVLGDQFWLDDPLQDPPNAQLNCQQGIKDFTNALFEQGYGIYTFNDGVYCYTWFGTGSTQAEIDTRTACI